VGIRDLFGQKQTLAGHGSHGIEVRLGELSRDSQARESCEGHGNLIMFQVRASQVSPWGAFSSTFFCRSTDEPEGQAGGDPPKAHIGFDREQITYAARVRRAGSRLEHVPAILRVEHWGDDAR
jgi:hypothetical protein